MFKLEKEKEFCQILGRILKGSRSINNCSQVKLAKLTGLSQSVISSLEAGDIASIKTFARAFLALSVPLSQAIRLTEVSLGLDCNPNPMLDLLIDKPGVVSLVNKLNGGE